MAVIIDHGHAVPFPGLGEAPPHTAKAGMWYSLEPADVSTVPAILNCAHVAAASRDDLTKLGWDAERPPTLNYASPLGLYIIMFGGPGGQRPGTSPSPAPTSTP